MNCVRDRWTEGRKKIKEREGREGREGGMGGEVAPAVKSCRHKIETGDAPHLEHCAAGGCRRAGQC